MNPSLIAVFLTAFIVAISAEEAPDVSLPGVVDLTPENFDGIVNGGKHVLAEFYAPWCGHCKHLTPEYKKLGAMIAADPKLSSRVVIAKANADAHRSLGEKFDVQGFPTIKWLPRGKAPTKENAVDYNGPRTAEGFMTYINDQLAADKAFARVEALDAITSKFVSSSDKAAIVADVKAKVAALEGEEKSNGELYVKILEKAIEKDEYLTKEKARLEKMLTSGNVAAAKADEMSRKVNIMAAILGEE